MKETTEIYIYDKSQNWFNRRDIGAGIIVGILTIISFIVKNPMDKLLVIILIIFLLIEDIIFRYCLVIKKENKK